MVVGSNPTTPTINPYVNPPKSVNKNSRQTVNNDQFTTTFLNHISSAQTKLGLSDRALAKKLGSGTVKVVVTGDILDRNGNKVGDFYKTSLEAVEALEALLADYGVELWSKFYGKLN